ncbi:response regulator transcription factor [Actinokineospora spheciospongiae]|uniref:response regulator transcription factor n=1 Tax=Actinokineospora spheciospongiae TaxID=909613 RepID=UPI000D71A885|nr:response regulator transcription factor [Actinokineospora spheciospongiae]PWW50830.1 DNA-binding response OmpR family regulator [Actinokineospora spheciospongiae]
MARILAVDGEPGVERVLRGLFGGSGHEFVSTSDGRSALRLLYRVRPDLVLLGVELPGVDGWSVLERVRDLADLPVLLLGAHDTVSAKVRGLRAGADDYLAKPFSCSELLARVEALLRRCGGAGAGGAAGVFDDGLVRVDHRTRVVTAAGREVELTAIEFRLLTTLVRHAGAVLSLGQLLAAVWDDPAGVGPDRVKFAVLRLRRKLGWGGRDSPILAVRGVGYRYRAAPGRVRAHGVSGVVPEMS